LDSRNRIGCIKYRHIENAVETQFIASPIAIHRYKKAIHRYKKAIHRYKKAIHRYKKAIHRYKKKKL
jgi:hypothetical protein